MAEKIRTHHGVGVVKGATPTLPEINSWGVTTSITNGCRAIGISVSHGYALASRGEFPCRVIKVGNRYRVVTASLITLLAGA